MEAEITFSLHQMDLVMKLFLFYMWKKKVKQKMLPICLHYMFYGLINI